MALPWMANKQKQVGGITIEQRKPDGSTETQGTEGNENENSGLQSCAEDLIRAVHAKDPSGVAAAMRSAFEILESQPHDEAGESDATNQE